MTYRLSLSGFQDAVEHFHTVVEALDFYESLQEREGGHLALAVQNCTACKGIPSSSCFRESVCKPSPKNWKPCGSGRRKIA